MSNKAPPLPPRNLNTGGELYTGCFFQWKGLRSRHCFSLVESSTQAAKPYQKSSQPFAFIFQFVSCLKDPCPPPLSLHIPICLLCKGQRLIAPRPTTICLHIPLCLLYKGSLPPNHPPGALNGSRPLNVDFTGTNRACQRPENTIDWQSRGKPVTFLSSYGREYNPCFRVSCVCTTVTGSTIPVTGFHV